MEQDAPAYKTKPTPPGSTRLSERLFGYVNDNIIHQFLTTDLQMAALC
jgi:hypothetical protein